MGGGDQPEQFLTPGSGEERTASRNLDWAAVIEEVADVLGIDRFSVMAHSAGAPYALASSLRSSERIHGYIHLLAPWVSVTVDGGESFSARSILDYRLI